MTQIFVLPRDKNDSKKWKRSFSFSKKHVLFFLFFLAFFLLLFLLFKMTVASSDKKVSSIVYSDNSRSYVLETGFYDTITQNLYGRNIYDLRYLTLSTIEQNIAKSYPFLGSLEFTDFLDGKLFVDINFKEPIYIVRNFNQDYAVYGDFISSIVSGSALGKNSIVLSLPDYLSETQSLSGMFFTISAKYIENVLVYIHDNLPDTKKIVYLIGGERLLLLFEDKKIYINLYADIETQIDKLYTIQSSYSGYSLLSEIDLGSLDSVIVR